MQGKFIVFEGITGSGKKTHIKLVADRLQKLGKGVMILNFPDYGSEIARLTKRIDSDPFTLSLLFAADRARNQERIKSLLERENIVISDRYCYSNFAYQSVKGIPLKWLIEIEKNVIKPDIVILIDVPVDTSVSRVQQLNIEDFTKREIMDRLQRDRERLEKIRETYLNLAKKNREARWIVIDGSKEIRENHEQIWDAVSKELKLEES